jgi:hypothetical protein
LQATKKAWRFGVAFGKRQAGTEAKYSWFVDE